MKIINRAQISTIQKARRIIRIVLLKIVLRTFAIIKCEKQVPQCCGIWNPISSSGEKIPENNTIRIYSLRKVFFPLSDIRNHFLNNKLAIKRHCIFKKELIIKVSS